MLFPISSKLGSRPTFEEAFFNHRVRLHEWALQLTGQNHAEAEDLVQELYIRLARAGAIPDRIENTEYYLLTILRNLHHKLLKRARTSAIDELSIVDYEFVERSLKAVDRNGLYFIQEDLHRVCEYLCGRKNTSRAASIFILRYFLGYFPNEVINVVCSSRGAVDKAIRIARNEARLELQRPGVIQPFSNIGESKKDAPKALSDSQGLFLALRNKIFKSCLGECFDHSVLKEKYQGSSDGFVAAELAHLVSCPKCLDRTNRILDLPLLSERSPDEAIGRDTPQGPGSILGSSSSGSTRFRRRAQDRQRLAKRMQRRLEEVDQHRPQRLSISIDGDIRASQKVNSEHSELLAELGPSENPVYIEVLSEQNICMMFVFVQSLDQDNGLCQVQETALSDGRNIAVSVSFIGESPTVRVSYNDPLLAPDIEQETIEAASIVSGRQDRSLVFQLPWEDAKPKLLSHFWQRITRSPLLASATLFAACSIVCILWWEQNTPKMKPETLLLRAAQANATAASPRQSQVVYQKVRISTQHRVMERSIYRDPVKKRKFKQDQLNSDDLALKAKLNVAGVDWDEPLSAATYQNWRTHAHVTSDTVRETGQNLLTLTTTVSDAEVAEESLTIRENDFHPLTREIVFREQGQEQASMSVEIAELNYAVLDVDSMSPSLFDQPPSPIVPLLPTVANLPSAEELDMAELQVRRKLHELGADLGEDIHLTRSERNIQVAGVAPTSERARILRSSLYSVPHVVLAFHLPRGLSGTHVDSTQNQPEMDSSELLPPLLDEQLRRKFPNNTDRARQVSLLLGEADQCRWHARALKTLLQRYHSFDNPQVKKIADDHLQALSEATTAIASGISGIGQLRVPPEEQKDSITFTDIGNELTELSQGLEHDLVELLTDHATEGAPHSADDVAAHSQQRITRIHNLVTALR